ncbi:MAG: putative bifunctional diguanylate cyclase/phosphodiesterase [Sulfuricaulis sp.]
MLMQRLTMRASLTLTIVVMGLFALGLALLSGEVYRRQTLDNQRAAMVGMLSFKTGELLKDLEIKSRDLALTIQHGSEFRRAFADRDTRSLTRLLDRQFHQYLETAGVVKLQKLRAFDLDYALVAESSEGDPALADGKVVCPTLIEQARARRGHQRLPPISQLCVSAGQPYESVIVPIGGLRPMGYLQIITNPITSLIPLESSLGMPLKLILPSGQDIYRSRTWLPHEVMDDALVAEYPLQTPTGRPALTIAILKDIRPLYEKLATTRYLIMLVAGLITVLAIAVALLVLRRTTLRPLMALHDHVRNVRKDRARLGDTLASGGTLEIRELSRDFNALSMELRDMNLVLEHMAYIDRLTELPNRSHFHEYLRQRTKNRSRTPFALFIMDLDRFKEVNDTFGHDIGDQLLKQVSTRLKGVLLRPEALTRPNDGAAKNFENEIIARLGGDEFAAVVLGIDEASQAVPIAQKFIAAMGQAFQIGVHSFDVGVSIGIVLYPKDGADSMTLMRQGDIAMYQAKQSKRGYVFFDIERDHHKMLQLTFERDLRTAIGNEELELHYQPIIELRTNKVRGVEALVRWRHPRQGLIQPEKFIHVSEQCGLIPLLTRWVLNRALEHCSLWRRMGYPMDVSVNLSVMNLHEPDFADYVENTLRQCEVEPSSLSLELTESAVMSDPNHAYEVLSRLDALGVRISIDDFGTGYSSLAYLKLLPVDMIKIDKSFVIDMKQDNNDAVIVRSTIDLAHNMSLRVVAEGVENPETLRLLSALGCDEVQGFFVKPPLTYDELIEWLGSSTTSMKRRRGATANGSESPASVTLRRSHASRLPD